MNWPKYFIQWHLRSSMAQCFALMSHCGKLYIYIKERHETCSHFVLSGVYSSANKLAAVYGMQSLVSYFFGPSCDFRNFTYDQHHRLFSTSSSAFYHVGKRLSVLILWPSFCILAFISLCYSALIKLLLHFTAVLTIQTLVKLLLDSHHRTPCSVFFLDGYLYHIYPPATNVQRELWNSGQPPGHTGFDSTHGHREERDRAVGDSLAGWSDIK